MQRIILSIIILSTTLLFSCQEVIELDLNSSNPVVVIDGEISIGKTAAVQLSYTSDYFTTEEQQNIQDAVLTLSTSDGENEILAHLGNGKYTGSTILGKENTEYELQVDLLDQNFSGTSQIMSGFALTNINTIETVINRPNFRQENTSDSISYNVELVFTDDINQENNYLVEVLQNGKVGEYQNLLVSDQLYTLDGVIKYNPMMFQFAIGDTVQIRLTSLDENTYEFYNQLSDVSGGNGMQSMMSSSTPYNPSSNMGDDALGYFAAWAVVDTCIIIK